MLGVLAGAQTLPTARPGMETQVMELTVQGAVMRAVMKMNERSFRVFRLQLKGWEYPQPGFHTRQELPDPCELVHYIWRKFGDHEAVLKVFAALEHIHQSDILQELQQDLKKVRNHFVDKVQSEVIRWTMMVDPVLDDLRAQSLLTEEEFLSLKVKQSSVEKMMGLQVISASWDNSNMNRVYNILRRHNVEVMKALEMAEKEERQRHRPTDFSHCIDKHYKYLENNVDNLDPVLDDLLEQKKLSKEQYENFKTKMTPQDTMRRLYEITCFWNGPDKDFLYLTLRKYNYSVFRNLERCLVSTDHLVDIFRSFLMRKISAVDPVLHDLLLQKLLTQEQCNDLLKVASTKQKMRDLYGMITSWTSLQKDELYLAFRKHNFSAIRHIEKQLGRGHVVDTHRSDLIRMVTSVDPVLEDLRSKILSPKEYNELRKKSKSDEKMTGLCEVIDEQIYFSTKDDFYLSMRKHNTEVIRDLERRWTDDHFMNVYKSDLIRRITVVDPVLKDLLQQNILTRQQFDDLIKMASSEDKMRELCEMMNSWNNVRRDIFYLTLRRHNKLVVDHIERNWRLSEHDCDHFVDLHHKYLVAEITVVDPVLGDLQQKGILTPEQYNGLMKQESSKEKMEELYEIIKSCDDSGKDSFFWSLKEHNDSVIERLQRTWSGDHFVDAHRTDLVTEITVVDPVLGDLQQKGILTPEQYNGLMKHESSKEKMEELYEIIQSCDDSARYTISRSLEKHNYSVMERLQSRWSRVDFVDVHRTALVTEITVVDPILGELQQKGILTPEQYNGLMEKKTSIEKMEELCDIIQSCDDSAKDSCFWSLKKFNRSVVEDVQSRWSRATGSLLDGHQSLLKDQVHVMDPVLDDLLEQKILTQERYDDVIKMETSGGKIAGLYEVIGSLDNANKDMLYLTLRRYNYSFFRSTEPAFEKFTRHIPSFAYVETFLDKHPSDLMRRVTLVGPVLEDLLERKILTQEEYNRLCTMTTSEDQMRTVSELARSWSRASKMTFYRSLYRYSTWLLKNLESEDENLSGILKECSFTEEQFLDAHQPALIRGIVIVDPVLDDLHDIRLLTQTQYSSLTIEASYEEKMRELCDLIRRWEITDKARALSILCKYNGRALYDLQEIVTYKNTFLLGACSSRMSKCGLEEGTSHCKLCSKAEDFADVITPQATGNIYSLVLDGAGLFCCSETGIRFQVVRPVTVVYETDSWSNYRDLTNQYEAIGPLFNVRSVDEPCAVSAVYLPHSLCLQDFKGDKTWIVCGHIKDGNLVLEAPTITEPYYAVLENPSFSPIGVLMNILKLIISGLTAYTYHGMVLLYYNTIEMIPHNYREYKFHVYLLRHDRATEKGVDRYENDFGFTRLHKSTYINVLDKTKYKVEGPEDASILPETLMFENSRMLEPFPFSEISIESTVSADSGAAIILIVHPKEKDVPQANALIADPEDDSFWKAQVSKGELMRFTTLTPREGRVIEPAAHFVDRHREVLIRDIKSVEPVLDELFSSCLLTPEQYDKVCSKDTDQERMRQIYRFISPWGDQHKDIVHRALKNHNRAVISNLER